MCAQSIEFDLRAHSESLHKLHNLSLRKGLEEVRAKQELRTRTEIAQVGGPTHGRDVA